MTEDNEKTKTELRHIRGQYKGALTKLEQWLEQEDTGRDEFEVSAKLEMVDYYHKAFDGVQSRLELMDKTDEAERFKFDERVVSVKAKLKRLNFKLSSLSEKAKTGDGFQDAHDGSPIQVHVSAPPSIPLPKLKPFSGTDYLEYPIFLNAFKSLVESQEAKGLSDVKKFTILRDSLSGRAYDSIKHLLLTDDNYEAALKILDDRFMKRRLIFESLMKRVFDVPKLSGADGLRKMLDTMNANLNALIGLPATNEEIGFGLLVHHVLSRVDSNTLNKWEEVSCSKKDELPNWTELSEFLENRANMLESMAYLHLDKKDKPSPQPSKKSYLSTTQSKCASCSGNCGSLEQCKSFTEKTPRDRYSWVKSNQHCVRCLMLLPHTEKCAGSRCQTCRGNHNSLLHFDDFKAAAKTQTPESPAKNSYNVSRGNNGNKIQILGTALVNFQGKNGDWLPARVLIDSGSMTHFITKRLASKLRLKLKKASSPVIGLCGDMEIRESTKVAIKSLTSEFKEGIEALVLPKFNHLHPSQPLNKADFDIPSNLPLADPVFFQPQYVDAIIGVELAYKLLMVGQIQLTDKLLLQKTSLGWIIAGEVNCNNPNPNKLSFTASTTVSEIQTLDDALQRFWELDRVPSSPVYWSPSERFCEEHYRQNTTRDEAGRFVVKLPFMTSPSKLGESYSTARKRLMAVDRKLATDSNLRQLYTEFLTEYEQLGHMEEVITTNTEGLVYLPHHGVLKPDSTSTKLRVVFDASAPTSTGVSLNDTMPHGPTIQPTVFLILLRFRFHKVALCADIQKMYRQILVHPDNRRFQCILWHREGSSVPVTFKLNTVTYGTSSAPFLATRSLFELATTESDYPKASKAVLEQTYVDNTLSGCPTVNEALKLYHEITGLLAKSKLEMRKWCSNSCELLKSIPPEHQESLMQINDDEVAKTLGLNWSPTNDHFVFSLDTPPGGVKWCKRMIVSYIAKIFDPLGFLSPVVTKLKIFTQHLWSKKLHWDESLPQDAITEWLHVLKDLPALMEVKVPRYVWYDEEDLADVQLHCYADASGVAYGTVFYIRCTLNNGQVLITNLCSKSRVAPVKRVTLPRLELCGALLLADLLHIVRPTLKARLSKVFCWLDAQVALTWVTNSPHKYADFIASRVTSIQEKSSGCIWRHIPGKLNPADQLSRGMSSTALVKCTHWLHGPDYLYAAEENWQFQEPEPLDEDNDQLEPRKATFCFYARLEVDLIRQYKYHGSLARVQKTFAYVMRFLKAVERKPQPSSHQLSPTELEQGLRLAVRVVQAQNFHAEYQLLKTGNPISRRSKMVQLAPFIDDDGILRVGGRLENAPDLSFDERHPMLLPKSHPFTSSIFYHYHWSNLHVGPTALLAAVRRKFWSIGGRVLANQTFRRCIPCSRQSRQTYQQIMADLPAPRLEPFERLFEVSGLDLCGPFTIKQCGRGAPRITIHVAMFVCFRTRAVQVQYVMGEETDSIINTLLRFMSRASRPLEIWSDNGTNFHGANNVFQRIDWDKVDEWCRTQHRIQWKFIPARSPHHGGLWEAAVKAAKKHLLKVMQNQVLHIDAFLTLLAMIEAVLNSRPITPLAINPLDGQPLTPAHFLTGGPILTLPEPKLTDLPYSKRNLVRTWMHLNELKRHWLQRWQTEVRQSLQSRQKWNTASPNVRLNKTVMMVDKDRAPHAWTIARITKLFPGRDGRVRSVEITAPPLPTTPNEPRIFTRAITELVPLPQEDDNNGD